MVFPQEPIPVAIRERREGRTILPEVDVSVCRESYLIDPEVRSVIVGPDGEQGISVASCGETVYPSSASGSVTADIGVVAEEAPILALSRMESII